MSICSVIQDPLANAAALFASQGVTPQTIDYYDIFPQQAPNFGAQMLQAVYDFHEGSGTTVDDIYNSNNGTITGGTWQSGTKSLLLSGTSSLITTPLSYPAGNGGWEQAILCRGAATSGSAFEAIIGQLNTTAQIGGVCVIANYNGGVTPYFETKSSVSGMSANGPTTFNSNVWHILFLSVQTVAGETTAYVYDENGTQQIVTGASSTYINYSQGNILIGDAVNFEPGYNGQVAFWAHWSAPLTQSQRTQASAYIQNNILPAKGIVLGT